MFCVECGAGQAAGARFCGRCGHRLEESAPEQTRAVAPAPGSRFCRACHAELGPGEVFCSECGQPVPGRGGDDTPTVTQAPVPGPGSPTVVGGEPQTVAFSGELTAPAAPARGGSVAGAEPPGALPGPWASAPPVGPEPYRPRELAGPLMASFGARLGARCLDGLVMLAVLVVAAAIATAVGAVALNSAGVFGALILAYLLYAVVEAVVIAIIRVGGEGNRPGQTLGKAALGIRVVRDDEAGSRAGYGPAFGRFFINVVPVLGLLSCLSMLWTPDRRCWHDSWTGTRVERSAVPARARANRWDPAILATCLALVVSLGTVGLSGYLTRQTSIPYATGNTTYNNNIAGNDDTGAGSGGYANGGPGGYSGQDNNGTNGTDGGYGAGSGAGQAAEYCPVEGTPELYATTPKSILAICDTGNGLIYHGESNGQSITLPATRTANGYRAVNSGPTNTYYDIMPDDLQIRTKNTVLTDEPITEWEEVGH